MIRTAATNCRSFKSLSVSVGDGGILGYIIAVLDEIRDFVNSDFSTPLLKASLI